MAICMIDPVDVARNDFDSSHLLLKLRRMVVVARIVGDNFMDPSFVHRVVGFDLDTATFVRVKQDYDLVRSTLRDPNKGFASLAGEMGDLVQPRTKGAGRGTTSRAFYARPKFLAQILGGLN